MIFAEGHTTGGMGVIHFIYKKTMWGWSNTNSYVCLECGQVILRVEGDQLSKLKDKV